MKITQQLGRERYTFKDIKVGEMFFATENVYDASYGNFEREHLYLKIGQTDTDKTNAILIENGWENGKRMTFDKDVIVEYVEAEIVIRKRCEDYSPPLDIEKARAALNG